MVRQRRRLIPEAELKHTAIQAFLRVRYLLGKRSLLHKICILSDHIKLGRTYEADGLQLDATVEGHVDEQLLILLVAAQRA